MMRCAHKPSDSRHAFPSSARSRHRLSRRKDGHTWFRACLFHRNRLAWWRCDELYDVGRAGGARESLGRHSRWDGWFWDVDRLRRRQGRLVTSRIMFFRRCDAGGHCLSDSQMLRHARRQLFSVPAWTTSRLRGCRTLSLLSLANATRRPRNG